MSKFQSFDLRAFGIWGMRHDYFNIEAVIKIL